MTTERVNVVSDSMTSEIVRDAVEVARSKGYEPTGGITVRSGPAGFSKQAHSAADLTDSDIVKVDGMDLTVAFAKRLDISR